MAVSTGPEAVTGYRDFFAYPARNLDERRIKLTAAWNAYHGLLTPPLKIRPGQPNDNVQVNVSRTIVDKGVGFLFGKGVQWNLDDAEPRSDLEHYLDDTWTANRGDVLLHHLATNGGVSGMAFARLRVERPYIRITAVDSTKMEVDTADDDCTRVLSYTIHWDGRNRVTKKPMKYRQVIARVDAGQLVDEFGTITAYPAYWTITDQEADAVDGIQMQPLSWRTVGTETWPYEFAPIVECQNLPLPNSYWGTSDLEADIIHLNEAINRSLSNINRILRLHAHPKTWSKGLTESQIRQIVVDPEGMIHLPGEQASLQNLEMVSDLASSLNYYKSLREALYEISRVPKIAFGSEENVNYLAAMAMQVLYGPLMEKTEVKRKTYGHLVIELNRRILALSGQGDANLCTLVWPNILPRDLMMESQTAVTDLQTGVSVDTSLESRGYNPTVERARRAQDHLETVQQATAMAKAEAVANPPPPGASRDQPAAA